jgi:hypothetical protein
MTAIPWTEITPGMVNEARLEQGRQRMLRYGAASVAGLPDQVLLWYADPEDEVRATIAAALGEEIG